MSVLTIHFIGLDVGVHIGGSNRFREETINQTKSIDFLFSQTELNPPCAQIKPNRAEPVRFGYGFFFPQKMAVQLVRDFRLRVTGQ